MSHSRSTRVRLFFSIHTLPALCFKKEAIRELTKILKSSREDNPTNLELCTLGD